MFHAWISWFSSADLFLFHSCNTIMKSSSTLGRSVRSWRGRTIRGPASPSPLIDPWWAWYQWVPAGSALNLWKHKQHNDRWFEMVPYLEWVDMLMLNKKTFSCKDLHVCTISRKILRKSKYKDFFHWIINMLLMNHGLFFWLNV